MAPPVRVLVVEDDAALRELVAEALSDEGYEVLGAPDGRAALALLAAPPPGLGLILLDLRLPGADGAAVAAACRRRPGPRVPVLVFSAAAEAASLVAELGAVGAIAKPFELEELLAAVRRYAAPPAPAP